MALNDLPGSWQGGLAETWNEFVPVVGISPMQWRNAHGHAMRCLRRKQGLGLPGRRSRAVEIQKKASPVRLPSAVARRRGGIGTSTWQRWLTWRSMAAVFPSLVKWARPVSQHLASHLCPH